jgi:hypothetical protein
MLCRCCLIFIVRDALLLLSSRYRSLIPLTAAPSTVMLMGAVMVTPYVTRLASARTLNTILGTAAIHSLGFDGLKRLV